MELDSSFDCDTVRHHASGKLGQVLHTGTNWCTTASVASSTTHRVACADVFRALLVHFCLLQVTLDSYAEILENAMAIPAMKGLQP